MFIISQPTLPDNFWKECEEAEWKFLVLSIISVVTIYGNSLYNKLSTSSNFLVKYVLKVSYKNTIPVESKKYFACHFRPLWNSRFGFKTIQI